MDTFIFGGGLDGSEKFIKVQSLNKTVLLSDYPATSFNIGDLASVTNGETEFLSSILSPWSAPKYKDPAGLYQVRDEGSGNQWYLFQNQTITAMKTLIFEVNDNWATFFAATPEFKAGNMVNYLGVTYINTTAAFSSTPPNLDDTNWGCHIDFTSRPNTPYKEGRVWYDGSNKNHRMDTGYNNVSLDVGREIYTEVYNNTGSIISNGDPVSLDGTFTGIYPNVIPSDSSDVFSAIAFAGAATMDIPVGETGLITPFGLVKNVNTQSLIKGFIYGDSSGWYTQTRPIFPEERVFVGAVIQTGVTDGILSINAQRLVRNDLGKTYSFTSQGVGAGLFYKGGFYDWNTTSITLSEISLTLLHGTVGRAYAAHVGIVPSSPGIVVGGGQVGLRVTGIEDREDNGQTAGQTAIITEDITSLTANIMAETSEKFSGQVTIELYIVSGTPTSYSLEFNYGYSKYDDLGNKDFSITGLECVWRGDATDTAFDIALLLHTSTGWTFAATGFTPGNGDIARKTVDQSLAGNVVNDEPGAWKRVSLDTFVNGAGSEGILFEIITAQNNTIQTMDLSISAVSEELR